MDVLEEIIEKIKHGKLEDIDPCFSELSDIVENDGFHDKDPVLFHIRRVTENVVFLTESSAWSGNYFSGKIGSFSRKDLLAVAAAFHDIAKGKVIQSDMGRTACPGHEDAGAEMVKEFFSGKKIGNDEFQYIYRIVKNHGVPYLCLRQDNRNIDADFRELAEKLEGVYPDILLFLKADITGSQLREKNRKLFDFLISNLDRQLQMVELSGSAV